MAKRESVASARVRAEVIRLVGLIPAGKFTTYGSIATHLNVNPRHVASILARLDAEESEDLPWHRVVGAEGRVSPKMDAALRAGQHARLGSEGIILDARGFILHPDRHFHVVGPRRETRWDED